MRTLRSLTGYPTTTAAQQLQAAVELRALAFSASQEAQALTVNAHTPTRRFASVPSLG